jgi:hypothetical protein
VPATVNILGDLGLTRRDLSRGTRGHRLPLPVEPQQRGGVLVQFIDVPEAHTVGPSAADAGGDNVGPGYPMAAARRWRGDGGRADITNGS